MNDKLSFQEWVDVYKKLIYWELELEKLEDEGMHEILTLQKAVVMFKHFPQFLLSEHDIFLLNQDDD